LLPTRPAKDFHLQSSAHARHTFDSLRLAEAADINNRERALDNLDLAVSAIRDAFDQLKSAALRCGRIEKRRPPVLAVPSRGSRAALA
jgi:hypothetical protein